MKKVILLAIIYSVSANLLFSQKFERNYDESKVGAYILPDPLITPDNVKITNSKQWKKQREYWINLFSENMYGHTPGKKVNLRAEVIETKSDALNNIAIRRRANIYFKNYPNLPPIELILYVPKSATRPVPVFLSLNFVGNHGVTTETDIPISDKWMQNGFDKSGKGIINWKANENSRGLQTRRWPLETILLRGYGVATAYYGDIEPDHPEGWRSGIRSVLGDTLKDNNWGAIGAWAWGMSRIMDYLITDKLVDKNKIIALGHSRLGKTALWAGAQDNRFAMTISNCSGEGGAAITRRNFGENQSDITKFPYWYNKNYFRFRDRVKDLPFDQHILLSLIAPKYLYVGSASKDLWADPHGEFLGAVAAGKVYELYGKIGLGTDIWPSVNMPIGETIGYHLRDGIHDILIYDWERYMDFADRKLKTKK
ncbi:MAG: hypothetical protein RBS73_05810 [Prolixibacteraceae bacterium]|jgi:hypothetical protein|nr:hypothetical protein [Prolixibacteraceae bacterium]